MSQPALKSLSQKMSGIDITMFSTQSVGGQVASRPMSNNGEVEYDGTSYYFAFADSSVVKDVKRDPEVALNFQSKGGLYVSVQGKAKLSTDKDEMAEHWKPELKQWFKDGLETEGITMIEVDAKHIRYWDTSSEAYDEGQIDL
jgi:general stress protein 26